MEKCVDCGDESVVEETENGQKVRVCMTCGAMDKNVEELTSSNQFIGTSITNCNGTGPKTTQHYMKTGEPTEQKGRTNSIKMITNVGNQLHFTKDMLQDAVDLFEKVYFDELHWHSNDKKVAMCIACLYVTSRIHRIGLCVTDIGGFLTVEKPAIRFGEALKILKTKYNVNFPSSSLELEASSIMSLAKFDKGVINLTKKLLLVLQNMFFTQGHANRLTILPAAYLAWRASDFTNNYKVNFSAFCKKFGLGASKLCIARKSEMQKVLTLMAEQLPWIKASKIKVEDVEPHLLDVLTYQTTLRSDAIRSAISAFLDEEKLESMEEDEMLEQYGAALRRNGKPNNMKRCLDQSMSEDLQVTKKIKSCENSSVKNEHSNGYSNDNSELVDHGSDDDTDV